jgi:hypothetical protein
MKDIKIGDKVYQKDGTGRIYESTVKDIYPYNGQIIYDTDSIAFDKRAIGTSIFLTREELEA